MIATPTATTTMPLRFCLVTTFYPPLNFGGDGVAVRHLARALVARGHEVTVVHDADAFATLGGRPAHESADVAASTSAAHPVDELDARITTVPIRSGAPPVLSSLVTQQTGRPGLKAGRLRAALDRDFDVTHFHNVSLVGGPGVLSMGRGATLYTAHEHWLVCPTHVLWRHDREPCMARECLRCVLHHHRPPPVWRWTGLLERELRHVDEFIALSDFSRAKHHEFGFPRPMSVIPDFLPARAPLAAATGASPHARPYVLYVGRLERIKGLDDVVPAFAAADADVPDLVVAGDGTHRDALERLAAGSPRVRFLGRVSQEELATWYAHAVAAVVPTRGFETFGLVVIEAFRAGTPVLARRMGPLPELVEASAGGGALFDDAAGLLAHARRLAGDPVARADAARAASAAFHAHWREDVVMPSYLALVERAVERRRRAAPGVTASAGAYAAPASSAAVSPVARAARAAR